MKRSIDTLKAACKSLRFILEETVPAGPDLDEAMSHLRSLFYISKEAIVAEADAVDREIEEHFEQEAQDLNERLEVDPEAQETFVRGTLVSVSHVVTLVSQGWDDDAILRTHPELELDDLLACLAHQEAA